MKKTVKKIKTYTGNVNIVNNNNLERRILNTMILALGILALCYVIFLSNMIFNIVERKTLEADARNLSTEVGDLELQYLAASNKIDLSLASNMGFKETKQQFATRKHFGSLNIAGNEL